MSDQITEVLVKDVYLDHAFNTRKAVTPVDIIALADNIKSIGLISPIVIQPYTKMPGFKYRVVAGHRRFAAVSHLKWEKVNCVIRTDLSDEDALTVNLLENIARRDLSIMEEARALKRYFDWGWSQKRVADKLSKPPAWVNVRYQLLRLPQEIQDHAEAGMLTQIQIRDISSLPYESDQLEACKRAIDHRERGEKLVRLKPSATAKKSIFSKGKPRERKEIGEMQEHIQSALGNENFGARVLAWCAGLISSHELYESIQQECALLDINYEIPVEFE